MATDGVDWPAFSVQLDFTDAELAAYARASAAARNRLIGSSWFRLALAASLVFGFAAVWAFGALAAIAPQGAGPLGLAVVAAFWFGLYAPRVIMTQRLRRRQIEDFRLRWRDARLRVGRRGLILRLEDAAAAYRLAAIRAVTSTDGLVLLWTSDSTPLAVPARLLGVEQRQRLLQLLSSG